MRAGEGMVLVRSQLRGKQPRLSDRQQKGRRRMHDSGDYSLSGLTELFGVSRPPVYRTLQRPPRPA